MALLVPPPLRLSGKELYRMERGARRAGALQHVGMWSAVVGFVESQGIKAHLRGFILKMRVDWSCSQKPLEFRGL